MSYKISSITTLINRAFILTSCYALFHKEIKYLRNYFTQNAYSFKLFNVTLQKNLNKKFAKPYITQHDVPKKTVYLELPYIGHQSKKNDPKSQTISGEIFPAP